MKLLTVTTRAPGRCSSAGISCPVNANGPRWLVPNCISKPSTVSIFGIAITPALLTRMSIGSLPYAVANSRTDDRSARSS